MVNIFIASERNGNGWQLPEESQIESLRLNPPQLVRNSAAEV
jgi:hypothetical protein